MTERPRERPLAVLAEVPGAGATGLEPATSGVTGRRSNQLNYAPGSRGSVASDHSSHMDWLDDTELRICLGCMRLADDAAIVAAADAGVTVFDTARSYAGNEELVARALRGRTV